MDREWLVFFVGLIIIIVFVIKYVITARRSDKKNANLEKMKIQYIKGEITREQYEEVIRKLPQPVHKNQPESGKSLPTDSI